MAALFSQIHPKCTCVWWKRDKKKKKRPSNKKYAVRGFSSYVDATVGRHLKDLGFPRGDLADRYKRGEGGLRGGSGVDHALVEEGQVERVLAELQGCADYCWVQQQLFGAGAGHGGVVRVHDVDRDALRRGASVTTSNLSTNLTHT